MSDKTMYMYGLLGKVGRDEGLIETDAVEDLVQQLWKRVYNETTSDTELGHLISIGARWYAPADQLVRLLIYYGFEAKRKYLIEIKP